MHAQEHQVGVLNKLLHTRAKLGTGSTINHSMICTDAEVNRVCFLNSHTVWVLVIINQLSNPVGLANRNNSTLGSQNGWYEVSPSDVTNT